MNRNLLFIILSLFTWGMGEGLFLYFQPIYMQQLGADPILIGGILGVTGVAMALAQIPSGVLADKVGSRGLMWASWILGAISAAMMALAHSLPLFAAGIILYGASGFAIAPMNRYITGVRGKFTVGRSLTLVSGLYNLGAVIGPVTGGLIAQKYGFRTIYWISTIIFVLSTVLILFIEKNPPQHHEDAQSTSSRGIRKNAVFIGFTAIVFFLMFALYLPFPLTPNFLENQQGFSSSTIGILGTVGSLGNAITMLVLGTLRPIAGFMVGQVMVAGMSALFMLGNTPLWFGAGYFLFAGFRLSKSMVLAFARPLVHPSEIGLAYGILETVNSVAIILAPVVAGFLYDYSPVMVYRVALIAMLITIIVSAAALPQFKRRSLEAPVAAKEPAIDD